LNGGDGGTLGVLLGVAEFEDKLFLRGVECNIPKKIRPKVDLRCVDVGKGCGSLDAKAEVIWGVGSFLPQNPMWPPLFPPPPLLATTLPLFSLGWPPPLLPWQPPTISSSSLDLPLPHAARIEKRRSKMD
jgi:hypothetical protein